MWDSVWHALDAIHAYDTGSTDSGVRDEALRRRCVEVVDAMTELEVRLGLSRFCRDQFLSDAALSSGYGIEDATEFFQWIDNGDYVRPLR